MGEDSPCEPRPSGSAVVTVGTILTPASVGYGTRLTRWPGGPAKPAASSLCSIGTHVSPLGRVRSLAPPFSPPSSPALYRNHWTWRTDDDRR